MADLFQFGPTGRGIYVDASGALQINTSPSASGFIFGYGTEGFPLLVDASGNLKVNDANPTPHATALNELTDVSTSGAISGQFLEYNGASWLPGDLIVGFDELLDVIVTSATSGQSVEFDGSVWRNVNAAAATNLSGLSDTTITTPASGEFLEYNGSAWVNKADVFTTVSGSLTLNKTTHRYIKVDTSGGDVTLTLPLSSDGLHLYDLWKTTSDTNDVIISRAGSDTIIGETTFTFNTQWAHYELVADTGTGWLIK